MRWAHRPPGSNWGEFGPDDQLGRVNLLRDPARVLRAAQEIRAGVTFALSLPLDLPGKSALNPRRRPPLLFAIERPNGQPNYGYALSEDYPDLTDVVCDEAVVMFTQYSTQWDSLAHVGSEFDVDGDGVKQRVFYNGYRAGVDIQMPDAPAPDAAERRHERPRAAALGIDTMAATGVQGRGVMLDLAHHLGREPGPVGYDALAQVMAADGITVETGDIVCLHTGYGALLMEMAGEPDMDRLNRCATLDGRDKRLQDWITGSGLVALVADNYAVEAFPASRVEAGCAHAALPLHELCLFKLGVPLGELWYLSELAAWLREAGRTRFFLTAPPLRLPGAVGSPTTPVATV